MPVPQSFIKSVAIEIAGEYAFENSPFPSQEDIPGSKNQIKNHRPPFFGRHKQKSKFLEFLRNKSQKGVFLVTGFRGMGKTSFVNKVMEDYKGGDKSIMPIHLTITQNQPKEIDILRLMVNTVFDSYLKYKYTTKRPLFKFLPFIKIRGIHYKKYFKVALILIFLFNLFILTAKPFLFAKNATLIEFIKTLNTYKFKGIISFINYSSLAIVFLSPIAIFILSWLENHDHVKPNAYNRIHRLVKRCHATLSEEKSNSQEAAMEHKMFKIKFFSAIQKSILTFPIATTKEIEYELRCFLSLAIEEGIKFIFIFDELDKVDPAISNLYYDEPDGQGKTNTVDNYQKSLRDRKQAIINIISGLKNFFTEANARFVFIAGREMFDASLADIADRQSSISSIFTHIFYIESLLKESELEEENKNAIKPVEMSSLSYATEVFVKHIIFSAQQLKAAKKNNTQPDKYPGLLELISTLTINENDSNQEKARQKIIFLLQNFLIYLTYRTNGSPKKIIKAIQEFIIVKHGEGFNGGQQVLLLAKHTPPINNINKKRYLYFGYYDQYRIGFINYLYRPFLIQFGKNFKLYSDNILISTPYLFDHLLRFHPFAFSKTHLELLPEVLSTNKTPSLREHINQIIAHLSTNHIRESEINLYDFKFYSRTYNEIVFLSKIFEDESAAFNFTLDESYLVKLHVIAKIKELRKIYSDFLGKSETGNQQIFSIAHLNGILGDLHFFDQEYDESIVAYSDAIRPINNLKLDTTNMRDFITLIRNKLKLGLCFEKINSFEQALGFYTDCNQNVQWFMNLQISKGKHFDIDEKNSSNLNQDTTEKPINFYSTMLSDLMQIISQSFLAILFIEEKLGVDGISPEKLFTGLSNYNKIVESLAKENIGSSFLMNANVFLLCGRLLYFKNSYSGFEGVKRLGNIVTDQLRSDIEALYTNFNESLTKNKEKRKPVLALYMYILGIQEVCKARHILQEDLTGDQQAALLIKNITAHNNILYYLLLELPKVIEVAGERFLASHYRFLANLLSNIGDCILSINPALKGKQSNAILRLTIKELFEEDKILDTGNHLTLDFEHYIKPCNKNTTTLADVIRCYSLSAKYFIKNGRNISASFQYRKILHVLRLFLGKQNEPVDKGRLEYRFIELLEKHLVTPALIIAGKNTGNSDRHMLQKFKKLFNANGQQQEAHIRKNISNHPESSEPVVLFMQIRLRLGLRFGDEHINNLISPYNSIATQYARMLELDLYAKYALKQLKAALDKDKDKNDEYWHDTEITKAVSYLFTLESMINILKIYGTDYMLGFSYLAYIHFSMAQFLQKIKDKKYSPAAMAATQATHLANYGRSNPENKNAYLVLDKIQKELEELFRRKSSHVVTDITFHYQMARDLYQKAIQLHTGGLEYKKMIGEMIYLEDDFNDNAYHFGVATDRYLLSTGIFEERIKICDEHISSTDFYTATYSHTTDGNIAPQP